jgi:hypothetical protein
MAEALTVTEIAETEVCPYCHGRGWLLGSVVERDGSEWPISYDCWFCDGKGAQPTTRPE